MANRLTRLQAALLGFVVLVSLAFGGFGLAALAAKDRLWAEHYDVTLSLADASDLPPGTPVRIRGVEAGHVYRVDYPEGDDAAVRVQLRLDAQYRNRIFNDATVRLQPIGMLGSKAIAISPGTPQAGVHDTNVLKVQPAADLNAVAEKLASVADEANALLKEVRSGNGTIAKLVNDDGLYRELNALAVDARAATGKVEKETVNFRSLVNDGRDTLRSVRQSTDALARMPIVRNYVENATPLLVRPECHKDAFNYAPLDLFEPGTAILHAAGRGHLATLAAMLKGSHPKASIVVAALVDPADATLTSEGAMEMTRKRAEVVVEALKAHGAHQTSFFSKNRSITPLSLGTGPSPLVEDLPAARVTVYAFTPH